MFTRTDESLALPNILRPSAPGFAPGFRQDRGLPYEGGASYLTAYVVQGRGLDMPFEAVPSGLDEDFELQGNYEDLEQFNELFDETIGEVNNGFVDHAREDYLDNLVKILEAMPINFRTRDKHLLDGIPLGVLAAYIRERSRNGDEELKSLYITGRTVNFENFTMKGELQLNPYQNVNIENPFYRPTFLFSTADEFNIYRFPLSQIWEEWISTEEIPLTMEDEYGIFAVNFHKFWKQAVSGSIGGSDKNCMVCFRDCYIERGFAFDIDEMRKKQPPTLRSLRLRTAGMRHILLTGKEFEVNTQFMGFAPPSGGDGEESDLDDSKFYLFCAGTTSNRNCFDDCFLRNYCFLLYHTRKNTERNSVSGGDPRSLLAVSHEEECHLEDYLMALQIIDEYHIHLANYFKKTKQEFLKTILGGYTNSHLNIIARFLLKRVKMLVNVWYLTGENATIWKNRIQIPASYLATLPVNGYGNPYDYEMIFIQCTDNGKVFYSRVVEEENDAYVNALGLTLHCVCIFGNSWRVQLECFLKNSITKRKQFHDIRMNWVAVIETFLIEYFDKLYLKSLGREAVHGDTGDFCSDEGLDYNWTEKEIQNLVCYQQERYDSLESVNTLIFNEPSRGVGNYSKTNAAKKRNYKSRNKTGNKRKRDEDLEEEEEETEDPSMKNYYFCFAYDIETVDYPPYEAAKKTIWKPFFKVNPNPELYTSSEQQVPYCTQWAPVRLDDVGDFLEAKKKAKMDNINEYQTIYKKYDEKSCVPGDERYGVMSDYLLDKVNVDYGFDFDGTGTYQLGKCIENMLVSIAATTYENGGKHAIAYAHNGAHFDAYVVLQFQRFKIRNILKTSRGILFVTLKVGILPFDKCVKDTPKVLVTLRDSILFMPGSLSRLCVGFNVPPPWRKTEFPITLVNYNNCFDEEVMLALKKYVKNDVKSLAYILNKCNELICSSTWKPYDITVLKPPLVQFITLMSMIRKSTDNHFKEYFKKKLEIQNLSIPRFSDKKRFSNDVLPKAIDIPYLRIHLKRACMGGRVYANYKSYFSTFFPDIMSRRHLGKEELKIWYRKMRENNACMQVLDVTSLYPTAQATCPMPTGKLYFANVMECERAIELIGCDACEKNRFPCEKHKHTDWNTCYMRPFVIIVVKNVRMLDHFGNEGWVRHNICGRKVHHVSKNGKSEASFLRFLNSEPNGLVYSWEDNKEFYNRKSTKESLTYFQSYSNVDLYWMRKQGFVFDIVAGFGFEVSLIYYSMIVPAFEQRIQAKKEGNKLKSDFFKLNYNGTFGVSIQQDINTSSCMLNFPPHLRTLHPKHPEILKYIKSNEFHQKGKISVDEEIGDEAYIFPSGQTFVTKKKLDHINEYFSCLSPMQIGCAVLSWARHLMNLIMFPVNAFEWGYTDTDSVLLTEKEVEKCSHIINENFDAPLGTLKNDHAEEGGKDARVFASFIGTKKVKMHWTLNSEGEIKVFNTFKGFNPSLDIEDENGNEIRYNGNYGEKIISKSLMQINEKNYADPALVQSWRRDLVKGVQIGNHYQKFQMQTYLSHSRGVYHTWNSAGFIEWFIPWGKKFDSKVEEWNNISNRGLFTRVPKCFEFGKKEKLKKNGEIMEMKVFMSEEQIIERNYSIQRNAFESMDWNGDFSSSFGRTTYEDLYQFIDEFYGKNENLIYSPTDSQDKEIYKFHSDLLRKTSEKNSKNWTYEYEVDETTAPEGWEELEDLAAEDLVFLEG